MRKATFAQSICRNKDGTVAVLFAMSLMILMGVGALSIDYGHWVNRKQHLADAADSASIAGIRTLVESLQADDQEVATAKAKATALNYVLGNNEPGAVAEVSVSVASPVRVGVALNVVGEQYFSGVIDSKPAIIHAFSQASVPRAADACVIALSQDASPGIEFSLSGEVKADNCSIWSNSGSDPSIIGKGSGSVTADTICAVGKAVPDGGLSLNPKPESNCFAVKDPFETWSPPVYATTCTAHKLVLDKPGNYTLKPGTYCRGITVKGQAKVTFEPGLYVIEGGALLVEGGGSVSGFDVTFLFTKGAYVDFGGAGVVDLAAPESGSLAGMLLVGGREEPVLNSVLRGGTIFRLHGHTYLPTHNVRYSGGPSGLLSSSSYSTLTARTVKFEGSSQASFRNNSTTSSYAAKAFTRVLVTR